MRVRSQPPGDGPLSGPVEPCARRGPPHLPVSSPREALRLPSVEQTQLCIGPAVGAGRDAVGERAQSLGADSRLAALADHVASADVHVHGRGVAVEALLDDPVWGGRPALFAAVAFGLASFFVCDPPPGAVEVSLLDAFKEAQQVEPR